MKRNQAIIVALIALVLLVYVSAAGADTVVSEPGQGAGQASEPQGLAVDQETGRLYVADQDNDRVDVFDAEGHFEKAFGWGVDTKAGEAQTCTAVSTCNAGIAGAGAGQFDGPRSVAVDDDPASPSYRDVYVADFNNRRVEKFDPSGKFLLMFGGGVDKTTAGDVCTEESGHTCGAGSRGVGAGEFWGTNAEGSFQGEIVVGVGPLGAVYAGDSHFNEAEGEESRVQWFESSGNFMSQHALGKGRMSRLAVDSTGNFYAYLEGTDGLFHKYDASGNLLATLTGKNVGALTTDSADDLFVAEDGGIGGIGTNLSHIVEYDSGGIALRSFAYGSFLGGGSLTGLAPYHSISGDVYAAEDQSDFGGGVPTARVLHVPFPPPGPLGRSCRVTSHGNTKVTLGADVNPEGKATTSHFEYITDADFVANGDSFTGAHAAVSTVEGPSVGSDFELHDASGEASVAPETKYHCRVVATNADAPAGVVGPEGVFTSLAPLEIGETWVSDVGVEAVTLNASVDPLSIATTGYFEYVDEATYREDVKRAEEEARNPQEVREAGFAHAGRVPDEPIDFGFGEAFKVGSASVSGLSPGTVYRYRVVASDSFFEAGVPGPVKVFRTYRLGEGGLPDGRAYELVSPGVKNNAEVGIPSIDAGLYDETSTRPQVAAGSGEAFTYTSWTSFGDPKSAPGTSQYLAKRTASGWTTENISPPGFLKNPTRPPYRGFSPDLAFSAFVTSEPPLTEDCQQGFENLYLREDESGAVQCLTTKPPVLDPKEARAFCTAYAGASADGSSAFFAANAALTADAPVGLGFSLYEWSAVGGLRLVSLLPGEIPAASFQRSAFGAAGGGCGTGEKRPAISADGSRAFWTFVPETGVSKLEARIDGTETVQLDVKQPGATGVSGRGAFQASSTDGADVFFTDDNRLTPGASDGDLYRYDLSAPEGEGLTDLTPGSEAANVLGVIGASVDGTYAYFVATGALSGGQVNHAGAQPQAGKPNLYLWHEGQAGVRFIATLSGEDSLDWNPAPRSQSASVSADGRHLAFLSIETEALSGYDNTIAQGSGCQPGNKNEIAGNPHCPEAYLYDAEADTFVCASCNPSGARPLGPAQLPGATNPYQGPRYLSADGSRLFFESRDALSTADENNRRDVYEFEQAGKGSCAPENPSFNVTTEGCLFLISNGKSGDESYLLDASTDARDVFFATRSALTGWDTNENYDIYDARENGGFPEPPTEPSPCLGETCKSSSIAVPLFGAPGSAAFSGIGNIAPPTAKTAPVLKRKPLTRAQKLAKTLKACRAEHKKRKRVACEKRARHAYGRGK